ncbi:glycosyltransferase family 4 protein, partial [Candidatus Falkowbacteria bacterium]|nr:glycosyltransferase family 4 protein [Candidatus Falkowbacteria bacterium]
IDLIFTQDPFETGLAGAVIAKIYKIKLQLQIHTDVFSPYFKLESLANGLRVVLGKFLIRKADGFRVVSRRIKESLVKLNVSVEKVFILPIFTDVEKIAVSPISVDLKKKYPRFNFIILMVCRLSREKNIPLAIDVVADIAKNHHGIGLVIVGSGREREKIIELGKQKLGDKLVLEEWTNNPASYYKSADLFLLTSNYEGWGLSVVEAMASNCPVVMTDVGCAGELIIHGRTGLVAPVGETGALSRAIDKMIKDEGLRREIAVNAKQAVKNLPDKNNYLEKYKKSWELALK